MVRLDLRDERPAPAPRLPCALAGRGAVRRRRHPLAPARRIRNRPLSRVPARHRLPLFPDAAALFGASRRGLRRGGSGARSLAAGVGSGRARSNCRALRHRATDRARALGRARASEPAGPRCRLPPRISDRSHGRPHPGSGAGRLLARARSRRRKRGRRSRRKAPMGALRPRRGSRDRLAPARPPRSGRIAAMGAGARAPPRGAGRTCDGARRDAAPALRGSALPGPTG